MEPSYGGEDVTYGGGVAADYGYTPPVLPSGAPVVTHSAKRGVNSAIGSAAVVTPDDANDLPNGITRALYVTEEGQLRVTLLDMGDGEFVDYPTIHNGRHPMFVKRVWEIGTTASFVAEY